MVGPGLGESRWAGGGGEILTGRGRGGQGRPAGRCAGLRAPRGRLEEWPLSWEVLGTGSALRALCGQCGGPRGWGERHPTVRLPSFPQMSVGAGGPRIHSRTCSALMEKSKQKSNPGPAHQCGAVGCHQAGCVAADACVPRMPGWFSAPETQQLQNPVPGLGRPEPKAQPAPGVGP